MNITLDEIRSKAPEGATHYFLYQDGMVLYYKKTLFIIEMFSFDDWLPSSHKDFSKLKPL